MHDERKTNTQTDVIVSVRVSANLTLGSNKSNTIHYNNLPEIMTSLGEKRYYNSLFQSPAIGSSGIQLIFLNVLSQQYFSQYPRLPVLYPWSMNCLFKFLEAFYCPLGQLSEKIV